MEEEKLIEAVLRLRVEAPEAETAAQILAALEAEGHGDLCLGAVKKAASKATKRAGPPPQKPAAPAAAPEISSEAKAERNAKAKAKAEKLKAAELKAAENAMMDAQRRLRIAKGSGDDGGAVQVQGGIELFIQQITTKALSGILEPGDEAVLAQRIEVHAALDPPASTRAASCWSYMPITTTSSARMTRVHHPSLRRRISRRLSG